MDRFNFYLPVCNEINFMYLWHNLNMANMAAIDFRREGEAEGGEEVYSRPVKAGRRTYFFDVKATRNDDYFLTITESRKKQDRDGNFIYDKHKIFLYREDFEKFADGLSEVMAFVREHQPEFFNNRATRPTAEETFSASSIDEEFDRL